MRWMFLPLFLGLPVGAVAHDYTLGDLVIAHPFAFETPTAAQTGAGYLTITNTGAEPDQLIAVEAPFPRVMLHETVLNDGVATMEHLDGITIAPGASVSLEPGGAHVMFMGLQGDPFEEGETITATLVFEKAGTIDIAFNVEARKDPSDEEHNH